MRGGRSGRDRRDERSELDSDRDRPAPGKVTSTQRIASPGHSSYSVAPGKRTLTMSLPSGPATPLPDADSWSKRMGADVSSTRLVTGPQAAESASAIGAHAFTVGKTIIFGDGAYQPSSPGGQHLIAHELAHTLQQPSDSITGGALPASQPGDAHEREAHSAADLVMAGQRAPRMSPAPAMVAGDWLPIGKAGGIPVGPGGPIQAPDQTPRPKKNAGEYLTEYGPKHASELPGHMGNVTFALPSRYVSWRGGNSKTFAEAVGEQIRIRATNNGKFEEVFKNTVAPANLWEIVNRARDADNPDHPEQADEYHKEVTLELCNAYRERVRESLDRMIPRYVNEWNRKTLEDYANRAKSGGSKGLTEHPESNRPGEGVRQAAPIDSVVLTALTGMTEANMVPDFAAYRKDYPAEAKVTARAGAKPIKSFTWQHDKGASNWIRVTDPADATIEDVAREMYGDDTMAYKITAAPPLFGLEPMGLKPDYYKALHAHGGGTSPELRPGGGPQTLPQQLLSGPLADEAALAQAKGFKPGPSDPAAMRQQFDQIIQHFTLIQGELGKIGEEDGQLVAAKQRVEQRKERITGSNPGEASAWSGQAREQLDILARSIEGVQKAKQMQEAMKAEPSGQAESQILHAKIARLYSRAASISDMVETARPMIEQAKRQTQTFVVDWLDEIFRYLRGAIINSRKNRRTGGAQDPALQVPGLDQREEEIRLELQKLRDQLLNNPDAVKGQLELVHKKLREMSVEVALIRNIDACDEAWVTLKGGQSTMGWIRSLVPIGDHGNDRLRALQGQANQFESDWKKILDEYRTGDKQKAIDALDKASKSEAWTSFFNSVAREIREQAEYDRLMIFGAMVGIAILSGGLGAIAEAAVGAGTILGFVVGLTTEVTVFTALSYAVTEKEHTVSGFWSEWKKNLGMFFLMRMVSGAWKVAGGEKGLGEAVAQYAVINGHALYEANQKKVREGKGPLSLGEVLELSLENLVFLIGVSIAGSLVQPWMSKLALRGAVGRRISEVDGLHKQVGDLAKKVEASKGKDQAAAKELLAKQGELLDKQGALLEELAKYADNPGAAKEAGITEAQLKQIQDARGRLDSGRRQIAMVKLMASLEPVSSSSFLIAKDGSIAGARGDFAAQLVAEASEPPAPGEGIKAVGEITTDSQTGAKSFTVEMKDGSSVRITERISNERMEQGSQRVSGAADPGAGGTCFVAGTLVATPGGPVAIENIRAGQTVLTWDPGAARPVTATVLGCMASEVPGTLELTVAGETIRCTSEHPFWVPGQGWLTASDLRPGAALLSGSGERLAVGAMRRIDGAVTVYNMEVAGLHTYLVSAARVLVHNKSQLWTLVEQAQSCEPRARELLEFVEKLPESAPDRARLLHDVKELQKDAAELSRKSKEKDATPEKMEPLRQHIDALQEKLVRFGEQARTMKEKADALDKARADLKAAEDQPGSGVDKPPGPDEVGLWDRVVNEAGAGADAKTILDRLEASLSGEHKEGLKKFRAERGDDAVRNVLSGMNQGGKKSMLRFLAEKNLTAEVRAQRLKAAADARTALARAKLDADGVLQGHAQVEKIASKVVSELPPGAGQAQVDDACGKAEVGDLVGDIGEAMASRELARTYTPEKGYEILTGLEIAREMPGETSISDYHRKNPHVTQRELAKLREGEGQVYTSEGEIDVLVVSREKSGKLKPAVFEQVKTGVSDRTADAAQQNTDSVANLGKIRDREPGLHIMNKLDKTRVGPPREGDFDFSKVDKDSAQGGPTQQTRGLQGKGFDHDIEVGQDGMTSKDQRSALEAVARLLVKERVVNKLNTTTVPPAGGGGG